MNNTVEIRTSSPRYLSYSDISLVPQYSEVGSRKFCNTSITLYGKEYKLPVIPANMKASISFKLAEQLDSYGYFYILHRFYPYDEIFEWIKKNQDLNTISISVGVREEDRKLLKRIFEADLRVDYITIDIAHGHSLLMKDMLEFILNIEKLVDLELNDLGPRIIAGNVADPEAVLDLIDWGADIIKVGIGQGHTCTTRLQTGFGVPMFTCVQECKSAAGDHLIIADGGIAYVGEIAKALVAGADMVMMGSMFARCLDSPAETDDGWVYNGAYKTRPKIETGEIYKIWYGSSTHHNKGYLKHNEGRSVREESNYMKYMDYLSYIEEHLQSSISYAGGYDLNILKETPYILL